MTEEKHGKDTDLNHDFYCKSMVYKGVFTATDRVNCLLPINGGEHILIGTYSGVYLIDQRPSNNNIEPWRILQTFGVTQLDILEKHRLFMVLSNGTLNTYPLGVLTNAIEHEEYVVCRPWKIQDNVNFFKIGSAMGRQFLCSVNTSLSSTTVKLFEPTSSSGSSNRRDEEPLALYKSFQFSTECWSVHFLKSTLCIGCTNGFQVINLHTSDIYPLLNPADNSLRFVSQKDYLRPLHVERLNGEFLLGYDEFSFFVNRNGWHVSPDWRVIWKGIPKSISVSYPYILAFGLDSVEIWHIETGKLLDIIVGHQIRLLHSHIGQTYYAFEGEGTEDVVASLTF